MKSRITPRRLAHVQQQHGSRGGSNGVSHYEMGPGFIRLRFRGGLRVYVYNANRPGLAKVLMMQYLALGRISGRRTSPGH